MFDVKVTVPSVYSFADANTAVCVVAAMVANAASMEAAKIDTRAAWVSVAAACSEREAA